MSKLRFQARIFLISLAAGLPACAALLALLWTGNHEPQVRYGLSLLADSQELTSALPRATVALRGHLLMAKYSITLTDEQLAFAKTVGGCRTVRQRQCGHSAGH